MFYSKQKLISQRFTAPPCWHGPLRVQKLTLWCSILLNRLGTLSMSGTFLLTKVRFGSLNRFAVLKQRDYLNELIEDPHLADTLLTIALILFRHHEAPQFYKFQFASPRQTYEQGHDFLIFSRTRFPANECDCQKRLKMARDSCVDI